MTDQEPDLIVGTRPVLELRSKAAVAVGVVWISVFVFFVIDRQR